MKAAIVLFLTLLVACNQTSTPSPTTDTLVVHDTLIVHDTVVVDTPKPPSKVYANKRFKEVTVERIGTNKFFIKGKGQIFEGQFSWVIEDGHEEIQKGFAMTDNGPPEWGKFGFVVDAQKKRPNSTLHLILFEISANDGSRQHQLPIMLY
ncbi:MAG: sporulation protein [Segetibacter sp.]|nr:sporulation protein [Segetibacter sp.]